MRDTHSLKAQQQSEELQEYGSRLAKQSKDMLHIGLSFGRLTPDQATTLAENCAGLIELGAILFQQEGVV